MKMSNVRIISLPKIIDERGNLSFIEENNQIPFIIERSYWIYDVPGGVKRGGHAYKENQEFIVALSGSFDVIIDDGKERKNYSLNRSYDGLYLPKGIGSLILYIYQIDIAQFIDDYIYSGKLFRIERIRYYTYDVWRPNNYLGIGFWERILLFILINLAYTDLLRKNKINRYNNVIYNLGVSVILLQLIYFSNPTITSRIRYYIVIFPIIFLSEYIYSETSNKMLKWLYLPALFAYLYMYTRFLSSYLA